MTVILTAGAECRMVIPAAISERPQSPKVGPGAEGLVCLPDSGTCLGNRDDPAVSKGQRHFFDNQVSRCSPARKYECRRSELDPLRVFISKIARLAKLPPILRRTDYSESSELSESKHR